MIEINGRVYPLWSQFVEQKNRWIGGILQTFEDGDFGETEITDIELEPNGEKSAFFRICGRDFNCGADVSICGIMGGESGWITFSGYGGHVWRIKFKSEEIEKQD